MATSTFQPGIEVQSLHSELLNQDLQLLAKLPWNYARSHAVRRPPKGCGVCGLAPYSPEARFQFTLNQCSAMLIANRYEELLRARLNPSVRRQNH